MTDRRIDGIEIRLTDIMLDNFRGLGSSYVQIRERIIVLIAENGGGKTTILDATAQCLYVFLSSLQGVEFAKNTNLTRKDIKNGTHGTLCSIKSEISYPAKVFDNLLDNEGNELLDEEGNNVEEEKIEQITETFDFRFSMTSIGKISATVNGFSYDDDEIGYKLNFSIHDFESNKQFLPVLVYYGGSGVNTMADTTDDLREGNMYHLYQNSLMPERFSFQSFLRWYDTEFKSFHFSKKDGEESKILNLINRCVEGLLNEDEVEKDFQNFRMKYTLSGDSMVIDKKVATGLYQEIEIAQMSAGEKMVFALAADLVKRFSLANPDLDNPLEGNGIILIDEIDLHLHPKWQRRVLYKLGDLFPNAQFIVSTHSPFVLQAIKPDEIQLTLVRNGQVEDLDRSYHYGRDIGSISYDLQGITRRPKEVDEKISNLYDLIEKGKLDDAREMIDKLSEHLSDFDEDLIKAKTFIEFYED